MNAIFTTSLESTGKENKDRAAQVVKTNFESTDFLKDVVISLKQISLL